METGDSRKQDRPHIERFGKSAVKATWGTGRVPPFRRGKKKGKKKAKIKRCPKSWGRKRVTDV